MIFKLKGKVEYILEESLVLNCGSVSFQIQTPTPILLKHQVGDPVDLFTYLYVKEKEIDIFGFDSLEQRKMFNLLTGISGIGPKSALGVLSQTDTKEIKTAVQQSDTSVFTSVSGIGKKNANRIILELKSKLDQETDFNLKQLEENPHNKQIISALTTLGYSKSEALSVIKKIDPELKLQQAVKECLKILGQ